MLLEALLGGSMGTSLLNTGLQYHFGKQNYQNQLGQQAYDRNLQQVIFNREDTAIQRRVADLKAAGLSPVLAAGQGAGTGGQVSTVTPQQSAPQMSDAAGGLMGLITQAQNLSNMEESKKLTEIQQEQGKSAIEKMAVDNAKTRVDTVAQQIENEKERWDLDYYKKSNLPTNASGLTKDINAGAGFIKGAADKLMEKLPGDQKNLQRQLDMINSVRIKKGLKPLHWDNGKLVE